jgi:GT2 family glycosyltransferase
MRISPLVVALSRFSYSRKILENHHELVEAEYLAANPDVKENGMRAIEHFLKFGINERRHKNIMSKKLESAWANVPNHEWFREMDQIRLSFGFERHLKIRGSGLDLPSLAETSLVDFEPKSIKKCSIVVPVHNAPEQTKFCLQSLLSLNPEDIEIIIVDDGSEQELANWLMSWCSANSAAYHRNAGVRGFPSACNAGLDISQSAWVLFLNSDAELTSHSFKEMLSVAESDERIGAVGPMSNNATYQSAPDVVRLGVWAENLISREDAKLIAKEMSDGELRLTGEAYLDVEILHGFCLMIRRKALRAAGHFDAKTFGSGYGEEVDLLLRIQSAGFKMVCALNSFCYHEGSASFGPSNRLNNEVEAGRQLHRLYPNFAWAELHNSMLEKRSLAFRRSDIWNFLRTNKSEGKVNIKGATSLTDITESSLRVPRVNLLLFEREVSGGSSLAIGLLNSLKNFGSWNVRLINDEVNRLEFEKYYAQVTNGTSFKWLSSSSDEELADAISPGDVVIATSFHSLRRWLNALQCNKSRHETTVSIEFLQDDERFFTTDETHFYNSHSVLQDFSKFANTYVFATTLNLAKLAREQFGLQTVVVPPFVDNRVFGRKRKGGQPKFDLVAMVRPETIRRAPFETSLILSEVSKLGFSVACFGASSNEIRDAGIVLDGNVVVLGRTAPSVTAEVLSQSKLFLDASFWQAFGLTSLEAMTEGCIPLMSTNVGLASAGVSPDSFIPIGYSPDATKELVSSLLGDPTRMHVHRDSSIRSSMCFSEEASGTIASSAISKIIMENYRKAEVEK